MTPWGGIGGLLGGVCAAVRHTEAISTAAASSSAREGAMVLCCSPCHAPDTTHTPGLELTNGTYYTRGAHEQPTNTLP